MAAADVGKAANQADDLAKLVGPLPGDGEGTDVPLLAPPSGSLVRMYFLPTSGSISSTRNRA